VFQTCRALQVAARYKAPRTPPFACGARTPLIRSNSAPNSVDLTRLCAWHSLTENRGFTEPPRFVHCSGPIPGATRQGPFTLAHWRAEVRMPRQHRGRRTKKRDFRLFFRSHIFPSCIGQNAVKLYKKSRAGASSGRGALAPHAALPRRQGRRANCYGKASARSQRAAGRVSRDPLRTSH
jgi:hypothetical protein